jgi:GTP-binding protein SAR1
MAIFDWFWQFLEVLGLSKKDAKILFLGLDNSGKTTLLHMLKHGKMVTLTPTLHPTSDTLDMGSVRFSAFDLGGHNQARHIWRQYFPEVSGIVFMVDASDSKRFEEARIELSSLLSMEALEKVPFLILGNKTDLPNTPPEEQLRHHLRLNETTGKHNPRLNGVRPIELFMCSIKNKSGYGEGFSWMAKYLN